MLTQNRRKVPYIIVLILVLVLAALHLVLAGTQNRYTDTFDNGLRLQGAYYVWYHVSRSSVAFIVVLTILSVIIAIILLVDVFCNFLKNRKVRHILITLLLIIIFALACIAAFLATVGQRQRQNYKDNNFIIPQKLDNFYYVAIADAILLFLLLLLPLFVIYYFSLDQLSFSSADPSPAFPQYPAPITSVRFN